MFTDRRSIHWLLSALVGLGLSGAVLADELKVAPAAENSSAAESSTERPTRGMSMDRVESTYGAPTKRVPAVGEPPISRWEYPGFVVYFERNLVIHSVAIG